MERERDGHPAHDPVARGSPESRSQPGRWGGSVNVATNDLDAASETLHSTGVDFHFSTWRYLGDEADMPILWRGELLYGALVACSDGRLPPLGKAPESAAARRRKIWQTARGVRGMTPASWHKIAMDAATVAPQTGVLAELQARFDAKRP